MTLSLRILNDPNETANVIDSTLSTCRLIKLVVKPRYQIHSGMAVTDQDQRLLVLPNMKSVLLIRAETGISNEIQLRV